MTLNTNKGFREEVGFDEYNTIAAKINELLAATFSISTPQAGDILRYDGNDFINTTLQASDIPNLDAGKVTSGTFDDARISQSSVTQHEGAITIQESQISDLSHYTSSDFDADFSSKTTDDLSEGTTNEYYTNEKVDDRVSNLLTAGTNINISYDDAAGTLTISSDQASTEKIQDAAWNVLGGVQTLISVTYDDANNQVDFQVENDLSQYDNSVSLFIDTAGNALTKTGTTLDVDESAINTTNLNNDAGWTSYDSADFDTDFSGKTTDDLSEGTTNKYYSDTLVSNNSDVSSNTTHRNSTGNPHNTSLEDVRSQNDTLSGAVNYNNNDVKNVRVGHFNQEVDNGDSGSSATIDFTQGNAHLINLTANCTLSFTNPPGPCRLQLRITNGGSYSITWPTITWLTSGGGAPSTSGNDLVALWFDGTNYTGILSNQS